MINCYSLKYNDLTLSLEKHIHRITYKTHIMYMQKMRISEGFILTNGMCILSESTGREGENNA